MGKIILMITGCFFVVSAFANNQLMFENKTINESSTKPKYEIKVNYPQIQNPKTPSERQFNFASKNFVEAKLKQFKNTLLNEWETKNLPQNIQENGSSLTINYDLATLEPKKIISLRYGSDSYLVGAAHGSHTYGTLNYDLENNKALTLADLFKSDSDYLNNIAKISAQKVKTKLKQAAGNNQVDLFKDGLVANNKNYSVWVLTPKGIQFTFNEYQVAPYVFGPQVITITYKQLDESLAPNTPLAKCLADNSCKFTMQNKN